LSFFFLGVSTTVFAQGSGGQKGTISLDAMTTPGRHFGMGFHITDHLSLRPTLGLGYSDFSGVFVNAGTDLRYDFSPDRDWSLYALGSVFYQGGQDASNSPTRPGQGYNGYSSYASYDGVYYGAGLGVRRRVGERLAFMLDGRYLHTAASQTSSSSFGQFRIDGQDSIVASLGLSFYLK
jgi:hypothetical protein